MLLYDCFLYNQKSELMTGNNKYYCSICKQLVDSIYTSKIFCSPNVLVLILDRENENKFDIKVDFTDELNIAQFILEKDLPRVIYKLYGVITQIGQSGSNNKSFIAFCKSPIDYNWYRYKDSDVTPIYDIRKEIVHFDTPYILFYQKYE